MKIVKYPQSVGCDYHVISEDGTHADVFYSAKEFKTDAEIEQFVTDCQKQRDEADAQMKDYVPPEQIRIQELETALVEKDAVIVEKDMIINAKTEHIDLLTKQLTDAKIVPIKEKPIRIIEEPISEVVE